MNIVESKIKTIFSKLLYFFYNNGNSLLKGKEVCQITSGIIKCILKNKIIILKKTKRYMLLKIVKKKKLNDFLLQRLPFSLITNNHGVLFRSSQCCTTCRTKAVVRATLSLG